MDEVKMILLALLIVLITVWFSTKSRNNALPGPNGLPIVGYMPFLTKKPYIKLTELAKTYGPVYSLPIGRKQVVILADFKCIKEAFESMDFIGRPPDLPFELTKESIKTQAFHGAPWKEQKRFSLHVLRDLGFGKTLLEEHMKEEILKVVDHMSEYAGKTIKISDVLESSVPNNIASLLFGRSLKYNDPLRHRLSFFICEIGRLSGALSWHIYFPWIRAFLKYFRIGNQGKLKEVTEDAKTFCRGEVKNHEASFDPNNLRDYVDRYLLEIKKKSDIPDSTFKRDVLTDLSRFFLGAGSETVRIAVDWMLLLCTVFPDVQKKIHHEIDEVLGRDRFPTGQDRSRMPYTEAALWEMMRWLSTLPLSIMRYTLKDTKLNGYFIPKHTYVLAVFWAVNHDESLWGKDVSTYRPERFLSDDGLKAVKPEYFIPFSIGKRSCPGKLLAEIEVFLYLTSILQKFEVRMPPGKHADLEGVLGVSLQPKRQELCLKLR